MTAVVAYEEKVGALSVVDVRAQVNLIQHIMREVMKKDEHYGVIPGTGTKPTLLKAGAEKLCLTFRLDPQYEIEKQSDGAHLTVTSKCNLFHIPSGQRYGSGMGSCSTKESKYAYRKSKRKCPACGAEAIMRSKFPPKGEPKAEPGWYCHSKQGGCNKQFGALDASIIEQHEGRVPNEDLADQYNTVLKMANKRSLVAAVLNATAASDIFTQDIEDMPQFSARVVAAEPDEDITEHIPSAPQASVPPSHPLNGAPAAAVFSSDESSPYISAEQVATLTAALAACDSRAESVFLKVAKIESLDKLLKEQDDADMYAGALAWVESRRARLGKPA